MVPNISNNTIVAFASPHIFKIFLFYYKREVLGIEPKCMLSVRSTHTRPLNLLNTRQWFWKTRLLPLRLFVWQQKVASRMYAYSGKLVI